MNDVITQSRAQPAKGAGRAWSRGLPAAWTGGSAHRRAHFHFGPHTSIGAGLLDPRPLLPSLAPILASDQDLACGMVHTRGQQLSVSGDLGLNGAAALDWNDARGLDAELADAEQAASSDLHGLHLTSIPVDTAKIPRDAYSEVSHGHYGYRSDFPSDFDRQGQRGEDSGSRDALRWSAEESGHVNGSCDKPLSVALSPEQRARLDGYIVAVAVAQFDLTHGPVAESVFPSYPDRSQYRPPLPKPEAPARRPYRPPLPPAPRGPLTQGECEALALSAFPDRLETSTGDGAVAYTSAIKTERPWTNTENADVRCQCAERETGRVRQRQSVGDVGSSAARLTQGYLDDEDLDDMDDQDVLEEGLINHGWAQKGDTSSETSSSLCAPATPSHTTHPALSLLPGLDARIGPVPPPRPASDSRSFSPSLSFQRSKSRSRSRSRSQSVKHPCTPTALTSDRPEQNASDRYYLFVYYRQRADASISRGYFQKSLVIVTPACQPAPLVSLWLRTVELVGEWYFDCAQSPQQRQDVLDHFLLSVASWPTLRPGRNLNLTLSLPILRRLNERGSPESLDTKRDRSTGEDETGHGCLPHCTSSAHHLAAPASCSLVKNSKGSTDTDTDADTDTLEVAFNVSLPLGSEFQHARDKALSESGQMQLASSVPLTPLLTAFGLGGASTRGLTESLHSLGLIADMWLVWELMLMGDPLLVTAPKCARQASEAALHLVNLLRPIPCCPAYCTVSGEADDGSPPPPRFGAGCWPLLPAAALAARARVPTEATPECALGRGAVVGTTAGHVRAWTPTLPKEKKASSLAVLRLGDAQADEKIGFEALRALGAPLPISRLPLHPEHTGLTPESIGDAGRLHRTPTSARSRHQAGPPSSRSNLSAPGTPSPPMSETNKVRFKASKSSSAQRGLSTSRTRRVRRDHRIIHMAEVAVRTGKRKECKYRLGRVVGRGVVRAGGRQRGYGTASELPLLARVDMGDSK